MKQIKHQAEIAMDEADVIVFVTNARDGITHKRIKKLQICYIKQINQLF